MLSSELHNRSTFLPFNMETHLVIDPDQELMMGHKLTDDGVML